MLLEQKSGKIFVDCGFSAQIFEGSSGVDQSQLTQKQLIDSND